MRHSKLLLLVVLAAFPAISAQAAPAGVAAAVAATDRPAAAVEQDASRKPVEVLTFLGLETGDAAVDVLTASGYYAEIMGRAVGPSGSVVAAQPAAFFPDEMKKAWESLPGRAPNVKLQLSNSPGFDLAAGAYDFILVHLNYHDLYGFMPSKPILAQDLFKAVKPGGIVGIVDHVGAAGADPKEAGGKLHRIDPALVRADFEAAGFVFDGESDVLRNPADDHTKAVFDPAVQGKTDRFVHRYRKPAN